jgi:prevent-host-death family protein
MRTLPSLVVIGIIDIAISIEATTMTKKISAMTVRKNLGEVLEGVFYNGDEVVVERAGKPMGVIVPLAQYERIQRLKADAKKHFESLWSKIPADQNIEIAEAEILAESQAVRHGKK